MNDITNSKIAVNKVTLKVNLQEKSNYSIANYTEYSGLHIICLSKLTNHIKKTGKPSMEFVVFDANQTVKSDYMPELKKVPSMFVYSDIIALLLVGNRHSALLKFNPIQSKFYH